MKERKFSVGIWAFTSCVDRFATTGYRNAFSLEEQIELVGKVKGLDGVILQFPTVVNEENAEKVKKLLLENNLKIAAVDANIFSAEFAQGSFTNGIDSVRDKAIRIAKGTVRMAKELGTNYIGLWLGQDGFDYPFQANHSLLWDREIEAINEIARYDPDVKVCLEYKLKEPRMHITVGTVGKALLVCEKIGLDNVGVTLDFGHALMCKENPAESATLLAKYNRLFSTHFNDCYGDADDDLMAGCVHPVETLELLFALQQINYDGWYGLDIFPYRENPVKATEYSIETINFLATLLKKINVEDILREQKKLDIIKIHELMKNVW